MKPGDVTIVVPTVGRPALAALLEELAAQEPAPGALVLADDRPPGGAPLEPLVPPALRERARVVATGGARGPAAARNAGWRAARTPWVAFLDDDVLPPPGWTAALLCDLAGAGPRVAGSQGRIRVPLPARRRPTDWERGVHGLEGARWATADLAYRRAALEDAGGFDERFPRAYREDADLALRLVRRGWELTRGERVVLHPPGTAPWWISVRRQAGNADDVLMRALHGADWRERAGAPAGRLRRHALVTALGAGALGAAALGHRGAAAALAAGWAAGAAELALARIAPGPRTPREVAAMLATSAAIPPAAVVHHLRGRRRLRALLADADRAPRPARPGAVLLDRDGTLVVDVPYNRDPALVRPMPTAPRALRRLREAGLPAAVISNQSGVARGLISDAELRAVNRRVDELLGPLDAWVVCPHGPEDGCGCRKPRPGMVREAARRLGVAPERCVVIGDIEADVQAARAAGARGILVPTPRTRPEEVARAAETAPDLDSAVRRVLEEAA